MKNLPEYFSFRESLVLSSDKEYIIFVDNEPITKLINNSTYQHELQPGTHIIQIKGFLKSKLTLYTEPGKSYYLKIKYINKLPYLYESNYEEVKKISDNREVSSANKYIGNLNYVPNNYIGLLMVGNYGLQSKNIVVFENGFHSGFSFGYGIGVGLQYRRDINKYFAIQTSTNYLYSRLIPRVENAKMVFNRFTSFLTPVLIIPLTNFNIGLGGGLNYTYGGKLNFDFTKLLVSNPYKDVWSYKPALGFHSCIFF